MRIKIDYHAAPPMWGGGRCHDACTVLTKRRIHCACVLQRQEAQQQAPQPQPQPPTDGDL
eukprot:COSAG01_NODE_1635_length_9663_cov_75.743831_6_plen_60_part_00